MAASCTPVDGGMLAPPGEPGSPPGAAGALPGADLLVVGERQAAAAAVGGRGEEEARLVQASCRK